VPDTRASAQIDVLLEERDVVSAMSEQRSRGEPSEACTDNDDPSHTGVDAHGLKKPR